MGESATPPTVCGIDEAALRDLHGWDAAEAIFRAVRGAEITALQVEELNAAEQFSQVDGPVRGAVVGVVMGARRPPGARGIAVLRGAISVHGATVVQLKYAQQRVDINARIGRRIHTVHDQDAFPHSFSSFYHIYPYVVIKKNRSGRNVVLPGMRGVRPLITAAVRHQQRTAPSDPPYPAVANVPLPFPGTRGSRPVEALRSEPCRRA